MKVIKGSIFFVVSIVLSVFCAQITHQQIVPRVFKADSKLIADTLNAITISENEKLSIGLASPEKGKTSVKFYELKKDTFEFARNEIDFYSNIPVSCREIFDRSVTYSIFAHISKQASDGSYSGECAAFYQVLNSGPLEIIKIDKIDIQHSTHSFARLLEKIAFNQSQTSPDKLKLCAQTRKLLSDGCDLSSDLSEQLDTSFRKINTAFIGRALMQGPIQFFTIMWAFFIFFGAVRTFFHHRIRDKLFNNAGGIDIDSLRNTLIEFAKGKGSVRLSAEDMMIWHVGSGNSQGKTDDSDAELTNQAFNRLKSARDIKIEEYEHDYDSPFRGSEHLVRLALIGTLIGIGQSLFESRNTESANLVEGMIVKTKMLSGIATAFGTTIVGVLMSFLIIATTSYFSAKSKSRVGSAYYKLLPHIEELNFKELDLPAYKHQVKSDNYFFYVLILVGLTVCYIYFFN